MRFAAALIFSAAFANAGVTYTCDPTINAAVAGLCDTLNNTTAAIYNNTFSNINAPIYITFGATGLGSSYGYLNMVPYSVYINAATAHASGSTVQTAAMAALKSNALPIYGSGMVTVSSALGQSLGIPNMAGTMSNGSYCPLPGANCYVGIITITNSSSTPLYYRTGTIARNAFDFFTTVEHETDEVLGTSSCMDTTGSTLSDFCGSGIPAAVDLFRYSAAGKLIPMSALSAVPGAYFSYDGGATDIVAGLFYNTLSNGNDYGDFLSTCPATQYYVQDAVNCSGTGAGLDITNDGGPEIKILNALGYTLAPVKNLPVIMNSGVVTTGTTLSTIESGSWVTIYGSNFATIPQDWTTSIVNGNEPTSLGNVSVTIDGKQAYVEYVNPTQINVQVPDDANVGPVNVAVTTLAGTSSNAMVTLASVSPAFFTLDGKYAAGVIPAASGVYLAGTPNSYDLLGPTGLFAYNTRPVKKGELLELYSTGFGPGMTPVPSGKLVATPVQAMYPVSLSIGNVVIITVAYITASGLYQINVTIPQNVANGDNLLRAMVNGVQSPAGIYITVQ